ncbi:hypothetical protein GCM10023321_80280 [Pseudonocardia eucalypti]|uniref:CopG-like ribbon-helix-helix domain-containing protein n=1 Tax=Pseudonocardia eucalypti TaxID=648755 RepID=A0ABP9RE77_9PSEU|nr:hypothetical protein [Pseudonocardia eucalypti]
MTTERVAGKPGPKPKGVRVQFPTYLPVELHREVEALAKRDGIAMTWVVTRLIAQALGRPVPAYCFPTGAKQGELPLNEAS